MQASKEQAFRGLHLSIKDATAGKYPATSKLFKSKDVIEGLRAFAEKRKPNWNGD